MTILYLDFETKDLGIAEGIGSGWAYKNKLSVIGYSYAMDDQPAKWVEGSNRLEALISCADIIVCHESSYDVGVLAMLGVDYSHAEIHDTKLIAKLYDNSWGADPVDGDASDDVYGSANERQSYTLDALGARYVGDTKLESEFKDIAKELKLVKTIKQDPVKYCKQNLDVVYTHYPQVVIDYANQDVELTRKLYKYLMKNMYEFDYKLLSDLIKAMIKSRLKGVRVDVQKIYYALDKIEEKLFEINQSLSSIAKGRSITSPTQLAEICDELGTKYELTKAGNPNLDKAWLNKQTGEFFESLKLFRKLNILKTTFLNKTISMISSIEGIPIEDVKNLKYSRIHPTINIFGATNTGRMSGTSPNIQQQPKRDEFSKPLIRAMFAPEDGEHIYALDFSSQEPRFQVHYSSSVGSKSGIEMASLWKLDPTYDMHGSVANMAGIDRNSAKIINLGLSYGMGLGKLSNSLKVDVGVAKALTAKYHKASPYLKELTTAAKNNILGRGYIKTLLGRRLKKDKTRVMEGKLQDFSYKAINKLIQGSAADQTMIALVMAYRNNIDFLFPVHDEVVISSKSELDVCKLKYILENVIKLNVPSVSEVTKGLNFSDQKPFTPNLSKEELDELDKFKNNFSPYLDVRKNEG